MTPGELQLVYELETVQYRNGRVQWDERARDGIRRFGEWCVAKSIDPRRWIRARLETQAAAVAKVGRRARAPKPYHLISEKFLETYREWAGDRAAEGIGQEEIARAVVVDPPRGGVELFPHAEAVKRAMTQSRELCLSAALTLTLGWNPRSPWCAACELAERCRMELPQAVRVARAWS